MKQIGRMDTDQIDDEDVDELDGSCWCGEPNPEYSDYLEMGCGGTGYLHCECAGDGLCVCCWHGEVECDGCEDCEPEYGDDEDYPLYDD